MSEALHVLRQMQPSYYPADEVAAAVRPVVVGQVTGPFGVGKSRGIRAALEVDPDFWAAQGFTTRPRRPEESATAYRFLERSPEELERLLRAVQSGRLVQYSVHPNDHVYGTDPYDYPRPCVLLDALASATSQLRQLPFKDHRVITVAVEPGAWDRSSRRRLQQLPVEEARVRLREGIESLAFSLEEGPDVLWVHNRRGQAAETGRQIAGLVKGEIEADPAARRVGERLLQHLEAKLEGR